MFQIDNAIYNGTLLQGIPCTLKYFDSRPKYTYTAYKNGRIVLGNYEGWHDLYDETRKITLSRLQNLFIHDLSHATLYMLRDETWRLTESDFGLSWDEVHLLNGPDIEGEAYFKVKNEREDEYRISVIHGIIMHSISKIAPMGTGSDALWHHLDSTRRVWHTRKVFGQSGQILKPVLTRKAMDVDRCIHEVYNEIGPGAVRDAARSLVKFYKGIS